MQRRPNDIQKNIKKLISENWRLVTAQKLIYEEITIKIIRKNKKYNNDKTNKRKLLR